MRHLIGNTYEIKEQIKEMGGKFDGQFWSVPEESYPYFESILGTQEIICTIFGSHSRVYEVIKFKDDFYERITSPRGIQLRKISKIACMDMCSDLPDDKFNYYFPA